MLGLFENRWKQRWIENTEWKVTAEHKFEIQTKTIQHCHDTSLSMRVNFITCYSDEVCLAILDILCVYAMVYMAKCSWMLSMCESELVFGSKLNR